MNMKASPSSLNTTVTVYPPSVVSEWLGNLDPALRLAWAAGIACLIFFTYTSRSKSPYDAIPAVGRTGFISSYIDVIRYTNQGLNFIMEGYSKHQPGVYRIPEMSRWRVLVSGPQLIHELGMAPDDVLSFAEGVKDTIVSEWTIGAISQYHVSAVKNQLTRNLEKVFSDFREEMVLAFDDHIPVTDDWNKLKAYESAKKIISRVSNRIFVGAPLCRDQEYLALCLNFAIDVIIGGRIISFFPNVLKQIAAQLFTNIPKTMRLTLKHLKPIIEKRLQEIEEHGCDYPGKPCDLLSWLLDEAQGEERTPENVTYRILLLNFAALHLTSASLTGALFDLASHPEYLKPLRQEIEAVIADAGWTKLAMTRMRKLDSFLKESQRMKSETLSMKRKALKEFTFSDGTRIPKGAFVSAVSTPRHLDDEVYPDAKIFNGFRFSDIQEAEGEKSRTQFVSTSTEFLAFGHGKHACPGRFFVAVELKAILAHVVLTYDLKMTDTPQYKHFGASNIPDRKAEVWFRKRRV